MVRGPTGREKGVFFEQTRREGIPDPYMPEKGWKEPTICPSCNAIYYKKRWSMDENLLFQIKRMKDIKYHKCPACRKIEDHYPMGILILSGDFVVEHRSDIVNLIKSEERRAMEKNPLERIMTIDKKNSGVYVETTTDSLALRIGRVLNRAYKGAEKFDWKYGDKFVEVEWKREK